MTHVSGFFSDMFSLPSAPGVQPEGASAENPVVLSGANADEFDALLTFVYGRHL